MRKVHPAVIDGLKEDLKRHKPTFVEPVAGSKTHAIYAIGDKRKELASPEMALAHALLAEAGLFAPQTLMDNSRILKLLSDGLALFNKENVGKAVVTMLTLGEVVETRGSVVDGDIDAGIISSTKNIELSIRSHGTTVAYEIERRLILKLALDEMERIFPIKEGGNGVFFRTLADSNARIGEILASAIGEGFNYQTFDIPESTTHVRAIIGEAFCVDHLSTEKALFSILVDNSVPLTSDISTLQDVMPSIEEVSALRASILEEGIPIEPNPILPKEGVAIAELEGLPVLCCVDDEGEGYATTLVVSYLERRIKELDEGMASLPDYLKTNLTGA